MIHCVYAVNVGTKYGVYLGKGLIITAAHVVGPASHESIVRIADMDLPAKVIRQSPYEWWEWEVLRGRRLKWSLIRAPALEALEDFLAKVCCRDTCKGVPV
jgi:hypothetical protein